MSFGMSENYLGSTGRPAQIGQNYFRGTANCMIFREKLPSSEGARILFIAHRLNREMSLIFMSLDYPWRNLGILLET